MTEKQPFPSSAFTTDVGITKQANNAAANNNLFIFFSLGYFCLDTKSHLAYNNKPLSVARYETIPRSNQAPEGDFCAEAS